MQNRKKVFEPQWALIGSIFLEASTKPESDKIRSSSDLHYREGINQGQGHRAIIWSDPGFVKGYCGDMSHENEYFKIIV